MLTNIAVHCIGATPATLNIFYKTSKQALFTGKDIKKTRTTNNTTTLQHTSIIPNKTFPFRCIDGLNLYFVLFPFLQLPHIKETKKNKIMANTSKQREYDSFQNKISTRLRKSSKKQKRKKTEQNALIQRVKQDITKT